MRDNEISYLRSMQQCRFPPVSRCVVDDVMYLYTHRALFVGRRLDEEN